MPYHPRLGNLRREPPEVTFPVGLAVLDAREDFFRRLLTESIQRRPRAILAGLGQRGEGPQAGGGVVAQTGGEELNARAFLIAEGGAADEGAVEERQRAGRVVLLESLTVHTSSRRWNQSLLLNAFIYATNWFWFKLFSTPLYRDFPVVRARSPQGPA